MHRQTLLYDGFYIAWFVFTSMYDSYESLWYTGKGIIDEWRELIGPTTVEEAKEKAPESLRAQYGTREMLNALHGSDSLQSASRLTFITRN